MFKFNNKGTRTKSIANSDQIFTHCMMLQKMPAEFELTASNLQFAGQLTKVAIA